MTDTTTHTRAYYEISLTNRQVLIAFSILLACVVAAFVSGLWVGRQAAARNIERESSRQASTRSGEGDEAFHFFEPDSPKSGTAEPASPPARASVPASRETPAVEPAATQPPPQRPTPPAGEESTPAADGGQDRSPAATTPSPAPTREARAEPPVTPTTEQAEPETAASEPSRPKVVDPPATSELSVIQVFSTADESQARAVHERLIGGGFRAFLSPVQVDGRTMYRVRVGPFRERAEAEREADKLKRLYKLDTWITN